MLAITEIGNATESAINVTSTSATNEIIATSFYVCLIAIQISITLSMGAIITIKEIVEHFKRPVCIITALISQFIAMPASAFGLICLMQFPPTIAFSAMISATCPGGSASNLFTHMHNGDVPLSIVLTTLSTVLAFGFMPLNLWLYTRQWEGGDQLKVPYKAIAITLLWILVPLMFGMIAKEFAPKLAKIINQLGSILGIVLMIVVGTLQCIMHTEAFKKGWKLWLIAVAIPIAGFLFGYFLAYLSRQPHKLRKTISLETGMQNVSLGTTIVVTSFPTQMHGQMTPLLIMNGIFTNSTVVILAVVLRIAHVFHNRKSARSISCIQKSDEVDSFIA